MASAIVTAIATKIAETTLASFVVDALLSAVVSTVFSAVTGAFSKKPKSPSIGNISNLGRDRTLNVRQPVTPRQEIFGEVRVGGPMTFLHATDDKEFLYMMIPHADHQVEQLGDLMIDDKIETFDPITGAATGNYLGVMWIENNLGMETQAASTMLTTDIPTKWTSSHRARGVAYTAVKLKADQDKFGGQVPNISRIVKGRKLYDPRDPGTAIVSSAAGGTDYALITTSTSHGLTANDRVFIRGHSGAVPSLAGDYLVDSVVDATSFKIFIGDSQAITTGGTGGTVTKMTWTDNAALCQAYKIVDGKYGLDADFDSEIDETSLIAQANICDEMVAVTERTFTFTADAATDALTRDDATSHYLQVGDKVWLSSTGTLPGGLSASTDYYLTRTGPDTFTLATSLANARVGTPTDITSAGTGIHTLTRKAEPRYCCRGTVDSARRPREWLGEMLTASAGRAINTGGSNWRLYAGAYDTPTISLDETDLRGPITVTTRQSRRALANAVKGVYVNPDDNWQPTDLPPVTSITYKAEDNNERIYRDIDAPYTTSATAGQRLEKIVLEEGRQQITCKLKCKLSAIRVIAGTTVTVTNNRFGWLSKPFRIMNWAFSTDRDSEGAPYLGVDLTLRETATTLWDWDPSLEETTVDPSPDTNLPSGLDVTAPTSLTLTSGTSELLTPTDGTIVSRLKLSWAAPTDAFVTSGGWIEWQYKKSADSIWTDGEALPGTTTEIYVSPAVDGISYDARIRSRNSIGVRSTWVAVTGHTVVGKTALPNDVATLSAQQNGTVVTFKWSAISDVDRTGYELRYAPRGAFDFGNATVLSKETKGTLVTNAGLPPGDWTVGIKAIDTSGNYSNAATTYDIIVTNTYDVVASLAVEAVRWPGTMPGFLRHDVSGKLIPDSNTLASAMSDAELWDQMTFDPVSAATYQAKNEIDLGFDATGVRVWGDLTAELGAGEIGVADPLLQIDTRNGAGSYDGFEDWSVGDVAARYIKARAKIDTSSGVAMLSGFLLTADVPERSENGSGLTVAAGGTAVTFADVFHSVPGIQATASGTSARFATYENASKTGFTVRVFDAGGVDVGGTVNWQATGA